MAACLCRRIALTIFTGLVAVVVSDASVTTAPRRMLDSCTGWQHQLATQVHSQASILQQHISPLLLSGRPVSAK
ncbi:hypothetical protein WJX77_005939 [Trebouxia sp. C0004]